MALVLKKDGDILPKGAVLITEDEALRYQIDIASRWPKLSEVWVLHLQSRWKLHNLRISSGSRWEWDQLLLEVLQWFQECS